MNTNKLLSIVSSPSPDADTRNNAALAELFNIAGGDYWGQAAAGLALDLAAHARDVGADGERLAATLRELSVETLSDSIPAHRREHYALIGRRQLIAVTEIVRSAFR
jgi:hypothetical protein